MLLVLLEMPLAWLRLALCSDRSFFSRERNPFESFAHRAVANWLCPVLSHVLLCQMSMPLSKVAKRFQVIYLRLRSVSVVPNCSHASRSLPPLQPQVQRIATDIEHPTHWVWSKVVGGKNSSILNNNKRSQTSVGHTKSLSKA
jgi:hypothetical protein